jgi:hypothetical protein
MLGPDAGFWHTAKDLLCRGMTSFLYERKIRIFDYPHQAGRALIIRNGGARPLITISKGASGQPVMGTGKSIT